MPVASSSAVQAIAPPGFLIPVTVAFVHSPLPAKSGAGGSAEEKGRQLLLPRKPFEDIGFHGFHLSEGLGFTGERFG